MLSNFSFARFKFSCRAVDTLGLPAYKGSTLRGAFGVIFRQVVCVTGLPVCRLCILRDRCPYSYIFETPYLADSRLAFPLPSPGLAVEGIRVEGSAVAPAQRTFDPHPFVIEPPLETREIYSPGETFDFHVVLIGKAIEYLPYFVLTFEEIGKRGIGRGRGKYRLEKVLGGAKTDRAAVAAHETELVVYDEQTRMFNPRFPIRRFLSDVCEEAAARYPADPPGDTSITLRFLTPTRIKHRNQLTSNVTFEVLVRALLRRLSLLSEIHCAEALLVDYPRLIQNARNSVRVVSANLYWHDWARYSARQQSKLKMGGFRGEITFAGSLKEYLPFLVLGQYLHVGKGTAYGLGKYEFLADR